MKTKRKKTKEQTNGKIDEQPISEMTEKEIKKYLNKKFPSTPLNIEHSLMNEIMDDELKIKWKKGKKIYKAEITTPQTEFLIDFLSMPKKIRKIIAKNGAVVKDKNGVIIFMSLPVMIRTLRAVMNLKGSKADITKKIIDIINTAKDSEYVDIPTPSINTMLAQAQTFGDSKSSTEPEAWRQINNSLKAMMGEFQNFANDNPNLAHAAIISGGFTIQKITPRGPQKWGVKNTAIQGTLAFKATGSRKRSFHVWYISVDGVNFEIFDMTLAAETMLRGRGEGTALFFKHQLYTKDGPQGFDDVVDITVSRVRK